MERPTAPSAPSDQKQMSGLEFVKGLADGTLPLNTIAWTLGYDIVEAGRTGASSWPPSRQPTISIRLAPCTAASRPTTAR